MNSEEQSRRESPKESEQSPHRVHASGRGKKPPVTSDLFAVVFGIFLGLAFLKFGNPTVLDSHIRPPASPGEALVRVWPTHWSVLALTPLVLAAIGLTVRNRLRWRGPWVLWVLPLIWFAWQVAATTRAVDTSLAWPTLWHFAGCFACYFIGGSVLGSDRGLRLLLIGVLAGFAFCLMRAAEQRLVEFPQQRQLFAEGERVGWTNIPPGIFRELKQEGVIVSTNGAEIVNPAIMAKLEKGRVHGTLVYPNALAGAVLLLFPMALFLAVNTTRSFRPLTRLGVLALTLALGLGGFFWSGSKSGWLIALTLGGVGLLRLNRPLRWKVGVLAVVFAIGLGAFGLRFHDYFASGATSAGARLDYWRAAVRIAVESPWLGTGPGTFQVRYSRLKAPEAEMTRLAHNDFLEQFSDSGFVGGLSYAAWIVVLLGTLGRWAWRSGDGLVLAGWFGLLGWFLQGLTEFSLYVPALAWTAFTLAGCLAALSRNRFDKGMPDR